jgi:hypothetical protein
MDYSGSMNEYCDNNPPGYSNPCPLSSLKTAAIQLINKIRTNPNNRVGAVKFSHAHDSAEDSNWIYHTKYVSLVNSHEDDQWKKFINNDDNTAADFIELSSTHMSSGLWYGTRELLQHGASDKEKVIIFFSDGVPNRSFNVSASPYLPAYHQAYCAPLTDTNNHQPCRCDNNECTEPASSFSPYYETIAGVPVYYLPAQKETSYTEHYGSFCTNQAISIAQYAKSKGITIYTVFLQNAYKAYCYTNTNTFQPVFPPSDYLERVIKLGRLTSFFISSEVNHSELYSDHALNFNNLTNYNYYKETADATQLGNLFDGILNTIITDGKASYGEVVPN